MDINYMDGYGRLRDFFIIIIMNKEFGFLKRVNFIH